MSRYFMDKTTMEGKACPKRAPEGPIMGIILLFSHEFHYTQSWKRIPGAGESMVQVKAVEVDFPGTLESEF